jgi:hypothetical protein
MAPRGAIFRLRSSQLEPHPEEPRRFARRLEGWPHIPIPSILRDARPDSASALPGERAPQDEESLLLHAVLNPMPARSRD